MGLLYERTGRLTAQNGGFRRGQIAENPRAMASSVTAPPLMATPSRAGLEGSQVGSQRGSASSQQGALRAAGRTPTGREDRYQDSILPYARVRNQRDADLDPGTDRLRI